MLQRIYRNNKIFRLLKKHLLMLILLEIVNKKQTFSIFMDVEDKHISLSKVLKMMNSIDNPSNAIEKFNDVFHN